MHAYTSVNEEKRGSVKEEDKQARQVKPRLVSRQREVSWSPAELQSAKGGRGPCVL